MSIKVKVVDAPLNYNLLLGQNWIYATKAVMYSILCDIFFPFEDHIVTIEQMSFDNSSSNALSGSTILDIDNSQPTTENVGVGMYPSTVVDGNFQYFSTNPSY